jgi:hypothetical protein
MNDKLAHFAVGFGLSILGVIYLPMVLSGFFFGVGKELLDFGSKRGHSDVMDALATFAGAGIATGIAFLVYIY